MFKQLATVDLTCQHTLSVTPTENLSEYNYMMLCGDELVEFLLLLLLVSKEMGKSDKYHIFSAYQGEESVFMVGVYFRLYGIYLFN